MRQSRLNEGLSNTYEPIGIDQAISWMAVPQGYYGRNQARLDPLLTVLRVVSAAAIAANVLYLLPDVTVDGKGHVVVVVRMLAAVPLLVAAQRHDFDQAERLFLGFLHRYGRFSAPCGKPSAVHDGGRWIHRRVIGRLEHRGRSEKKKTVLDFVLMINYLTYCSSFHRAQTSRTFT